MINDEFIDMAKLAQQLTEAVYILKADMTDEKREAFREAWSRYMGSGKPIITVPTSFNIQPMNEEAYLVKGELSYSEQTALKQAWERMNEQLPLPKKLIVMNPHIDVEPLRKSLFNFATALRLLDMGYCVERDTWTQGHIFKVGNVIKQSHDHKEWIPTQGAMRAVNWRIVEQGE